MFMRFLHSDFLKIKRSPILWVHIFVPLAGIILFLFPCFLKPKYAASIGGDMLGAIAVAFPTLIGLVCSMTAEQESGAGNFQELLTKSSRLIPFFSMTFMLLLLGLLASLLALYGVDGGLAAFFHTTQFGPDFYLLGALLIFGSNLFIYMFHIFLSFRFNGSVSIGVGITESMLSCLLVTGLGDGIWIFIPCAWGARFTDMFIHKSFGERITAASQLNAGVTLCCIETALIFVFSIIWFLRWEGKKTEE